MLTRSKVRGNIKRQTVTLGLVISVLSASAFSQTDKLDALLEAGHFKLVARSIDPSKNRDAETLYLLSKINEGFHKTDQAVSLAEAAVKLNPNKAKYHLQLAGVLSDRADNVNIFKKISLAGRIRSELETAVKLEPKNADCLFGLMMFYQAAPGVAGGSKDKARQTAEQIAQVDESMGYLAKARLALGSNEKDKVESLYVKAVKANPKNFEALMALGSYYASDAQKKYDLAEKYAKQALNLDATRNPPYVISAEAQAFKQRWEKLESVLSEAAQENPDDLNPFYQAGRTLLQLNQELSRAKRYMRKYLSQDPEALTRSLSAAHWRLGLILEKEGRKADAIKEMEESLRLQPDFENAKKDLKRLKG
ncbi:MAG TPA: tetratricopeptide repeat protein [Terriglobales bacterium]|nr:tetratricopeptide repeat protein [Terriglobales bacterium]